MKLARGTVIAIAIAGGACSKKINWATVGAEDDTTLIREYHTEMDKPPSWVLRLDIGSAHASAYVQHWTDDGLDLQLRTPQGAVDGKMTCTATEAVFTCDDRALDAKAGRVITFHINPLGQFGAPVQSDLAAYKRP